MEKPDGYVGQEGGEIELLSSFRSPSKRDSPREALDVDAEQADEEPEQNTDKWLPPTGHRNGKWWYSTYHNVTAMVGAGVLGLPSAMAHLGWGIGTTVLLLSWVITLYTLWQMVQMHEDKDGKRYDTYQALGQKAFGKKWGQWIVVPQQLIVQVGLDIVYIILGGQSLWNFYQLVGCRQITPLDIGEGNCCGPLGPGTFIIIFTLPQFFLAQLGNLNSIAGVSLAASVMSLGYCIIAWSLSIHEGQENRRQHEHISFNINHAFPHESLVFEAFSALGIVAFAYAGHNVVLEIQATLPSEGKAKPAKILMWRGVVVAYFVVAFCYFTVAFLGYWAFGNILAEVKYNTHNIKSPNNANILLRFEEPRWLLAIANLMVSTHMIGSYQLYAMPVFQMMESILVNKYGFPPPKSELTPYPTLRIVTRTSYVFLTGLIALTFPFFDTLLGLLGGFALAPTTYFLPCLIWLKLKLRTNEIKVFGLSWCINCVLIIIGVILMTLATIGGVQSFQSQLKHFKYFQITSKYCRR